MRRRRRAVARHRPRRQHARRSGGGQRRRVVVRPRRRDRRRATGRHPPASAHGVHDRLARRTSIRTASRWWPTSPAPSTSSRRARRSCAPPPTRCRRSPAMRGPTRSTSPRRSMSSTRRRRSTSATCVRRGPGCATSSPIASPVAGFDDEVDGFFWFVGQGGYGIQISPALARAGASLVRTGGLPDSLSDRGLDAGSARPATARQPDDARRPLTDPAALVWKRMLAAGIARSRLLPARPARCRGVPRRSPWPVGAAVVVPQGRNPRLNDRGPGAA